MRVRRVGRRGRPRRVSVLVDARAVVRTREKTTTMDDDDEHNVDETWKTFARRALERARDGRGRDEVMFRARAFDWTTAPHAFEGAVRRGTTEDDAEDAETRRRRRTRGDSVARQLGDVEDVCVRYARAEGDAMVKRASSCEASGGVLDAWMKNLTRHVGAAVDDPSEGGGFASAYADDDEDGGGESHGVLFVVAPLPEVTVEEMRTIDPMRVAATFTRVEERFERERVRAHLVYVGAPPTGVVATCLREVFRKLRGAVVSLDAATKIAAWTPLYSALDALVDGEGDGGRRLESRDATTNASTSAVDLVVETRGSASLRLGEAHRVGERDRGDGVVSIVGFVDRVDAPSATLATESQTIMFFDDSPVRALMAMLALKDAVAIVRRDARRFHQLAVLEPLTCSSFSVTSFKTMARVDAVDDDDGDDEGKAVETPTRADAMASTTGRELDALMARGSALVSLENVRALLARMRDDVARETMQTSPLPTQTTQTTQTTQDSLALTQHIAFTATDGVSQPRDGGRDRAPTTEVRTLAEAFAADAALGVRQCASRLESWYGAREYAPRVRGMLARVDTLDAGVSDELIKSLDARFKTMLKNQHVVVSPPRKSKARRSLASTLTAFSMDIDATPWTGDVDAAARAAYDDVVASFADGVEPPNAHNAVAELAYRFRLSATDCADDALVERLERALVVDFKTLQSKYVGSAASKNAKRLEFTLQMHAALRVAAIKVELARDAADADACEGVEERAMSKKEQKKLVKGVKKLVDEISFLLTPPGQEGVRALVESEFASHYAGALPSALQALQSALGVSSEAPPSATEDVSVALTPFSPQPLRRSPRKPKPPPRALPEPAAQKPKPPPRLPQQSDRGFNSRAQRRQVTLQRQTSFAKPSPRPPRAGGGTSRNLMKTFIGTPGPRRGGPTVVASTPVLANSTPGIVRATPAARPNGVVETTPFVPGRPFREYNAPTPRRLGDALDTPAPKRSRALDS